MTELSQRLVGLLALITACSAVVEFPLQHHGVQTSQTSPAAPFDTEPITISSSIPIKLHLKRPEGPQDAVPVVVEFVKPESASRLQRQSPLHDDPTTFDTLQHSTETRPSPSELVTLESLNTSLLSLRPMPAARRLLLVFFSTFISYLTLTQISKNLNPQTKWLGDEGREEARWVATSHSWLDRKACSWFGICGAAHVRSVANEAHTLKGKKRKEQELLKENEKHSSWVEGKTNPNDWTNDERVLREIPQYVLDHAPLVHLFSGEQFWPCDIEEHLNHITPHLNYTPLTSGLDHPNLTNLDKLNEWNRGRFVYLQSDDDVEERPGWLGGESNIPNAPGGSDGKDDEEEDSWPDWDGRVDGELPDDKETGREGWYDVGEGSTSDLGGGRPNLDDPNVPIPSDTIEGEELIGDVRKRALDKSLGKRTRGGRSDAPAVLVVVDKGNGVVDAFWFYFYSFNLGNVVFNVRFGNHVGDWEHSLVRFKDGKPKAVFCSEHNFGEAYSYEAVEKFGKRPVIYSATGTHAMYVTPGIHSYVLPWGLLHDQTDRGPLWDPALNSHTYTYDYLSDTLRSSNITPKAPTDWFYFAGHWGDKFYPLSDRRQYRFAGQYHYVNGPLGPRFKNLGRKKVCQGNDVCVIKNWIGPSKRLRRWKGIGQGEEMSEEDVKRFLPPDENL
ncbi:MAG: Vacuolar protein sorting-associated protein 62 [Pycnora praestabilis]|nr:MAG: Vacuolar protein sorting-associated protein 62 [Pycnora praestabilis]